MAQNAARKAQAAKKPLISEINILASHDAQGIFETAMAELGVPASTKAMVEYLGGLANYWTVRDWRRGRRKPSREVMDVLRSRCLDRMHRFEAIAVACERSELGVHQPNILAWNARRRS